MLALFGWMLNFALKVFWYFLVLAIFVSVLKEGKGTIGELALTISVGLKVALLKARKWLIGKLRKETEEEKPEEKEKEP